MQKILVIDDDRNKFLILNRFLTRQGFEVHEAYQGKKALEMEERNFPGREVTNFRTGGLE